MSDASADPPVKSQKKRPLRYKPSAGVYAFLDPRPNARRFSAKFAGLVLNQSFKGCALIFTPTEAPEIGAIVKLKLGPLDPVLAEIRWVDELRDGAYAVGLLLMI